MDRYGHAILAIERSGRIVYSNTAAGSAFGYSPTALIGVAIENLLPRQLAQVHKEHVRRWFEDPRPLPITGIRGSLSGRRSDGSEEPIGIFIVPFSVGEGSKEEVIALAQIYPHGGMESMFAQVKRSNLKATVMLVTVGILEALRFLGVL